MTYMEENPNGCTARVQESDGGADDAVSKCFKSHVIILKSI